MTQSERSRKIRVTYVIPSLEIGGAETQLVRLINGLDRDEFRPTVICLYSSGPLRSQLADGVEVVTLSLPRLSRLKRRAAAVTALRAITSMQAHMIRLRPDIVHGYLMTAYVLGAVAARSVGTPVVVASRRGLDSHRRRSSGHLRLAARLANTLIDYHLCNSEAVRRVAIEDERIPVSKTGVIYNGIESPVETDPVELPEEWGVSRDNRCVAMVANFSVDKRHTHVLDALRLVVEKQPGVKLILFGDGAERTAIERLVREGGLDQNVVFAGSRPDAARLLPRFDLSVLASANEGFPNALMESMALGVPVVATRVGGVPELVRDGVDGKLVEVGHPEQIAAAILEILAAPNLRRRMGDAARTRIRDSFPVGAMITQTQQLYVRLMSEKRGWHPVASIVHGLGWAGSLIGATAQVTSASN